MKAIGQAQPILWDNDAEIAVLGSIILDGQDHTDEGINGIRSFLRPEDFMDEQHQRIYRAMLSMEGKGIDEVTLAHQMRDTGTIQSGDCERITHCVVVTPTPFHIKYYAQIVRGFSDKRRAISEAAKAVKDAYQGKSSARDKFLELE